MWSYLETHQYWLVTVDVTVNNQAPIVTGNISKTGNTVTFTAIDFTTVFSDPDPGDTLSAVIITSLPTNNGVLSLGGAPIEVTGISVPLASLNSLVLTLDTSDLQASSFSFRLVDSSGAQSSNMGSVALSPLPAP